MSVTKHLKMVSALCAVLLLVLIPSQALAASTPKSTSTSSKNSTSTSASKAVNEAVAQVYIASTTLQPGMLVKLNDKDSSKVEPVTTATSAKILGVVVSPSSVPVALAPVNQSGQQVYVASFGTYDVLVTNQNGPIKIGDYISVSALDGIGMKASSAQTEVLGKATAAFSGTKDILGTAQLKNVLGQKVSVSIGVVPVAISVEYNPLVIQSESNIPAFLQRAGQLIAGKTVSATRIYMSLFVVFMATCLAIALVVSGVRNAMNAVGRNPLAKKTVTKNMVRIVAMSVIVFIIGLIGVYILLKI